MSFTPGQNFFLRLAGKLADAGKGYRLTACSMGALAGSTPTATAINPTATPSVTPTPTPAPPSNDVCGAVPAITLNVPIFGTLFGALDNFEIAALSTCFTNNGAIGNPTPAAVTATGRDVVFSFTAPTAGNYSFRGSNVSPNLIGGNMLIHVASDCPAGPGPNFPTCLGAANRNASTGGIYSSASGIEEVMCLPLAAGQTVFVYIDELSLATLDGQFMVEVTRCVRETEPNDLPAQANALACGIEASINRTATFTPTPTSTQDPVVTWTPTPSSTSTPFGQLTPTPTLQFFEFDFFTVPTPDSPDRRFFGMADAAAMNIADIDLRLNNNTLDILEYDSNDNDGFWGSAAGNIGGAPFNVTPAPGNFLQAFAPTFATTAEPYRIYAVSQPPITSAITETEPNNTIGTANTNVANYFFGSLTGKTLQNDNNLVGASSMSLDVDYYRFTATAGDVIYLGLDGDPLSQDGAYGKSPAKSQLALLDLNGNILVRANETGTTVGYGSGYGNPNTTVPQRGQASAVVLRAPYTGAYYAGVASGSNSTINPTITQFFSGANLFIGDYLLSISLNCAPAPQAPLQTATPTPTSTSTVTPTPGGPTAVPTIGGAVSGAVGGFGVGDVTLAKPTSAVAERSGSLPTDLVALALLAAAGVWIARRRR